MIIPLPEEGHGDPKLTGSYASKRRYTISFIVVLVFLGSFILKLISQQPLPRATRFHQVIMATHKEGFKSGDGGYRRGGNKV